MRVERELQVAGFCNRNYIIEVERREICIPVRINRANDDEYLADYELYEFPADVYKLLSSYKRIERENRR